MLQITQHCSTCQSTQCVEKHCTCIPSKSHITTATLNKTACATNGLGMSSIRHPITANWSYKQKKIVQITTMNYLASQASQSLGKVTKWENPSQMKREEPELQNSFMVFTDARIMRNLHFFLTCTTTFTAICGVNEWNKYEHPSVHVSVDTKNCGLGFWPLIFSQNKPIFSLYQIMRKIC